MRAPKKNDAVGRCKPPSGVRGEALEANAYWQQSTENCRIII